MPSLVLARGPEAPSRGLRALDGWLAGVAPALADRVRIAAGEALGNAVEHASAEQITIEWTPSERGGTLCVDDASDLDPARFHDAELPSDASAIHGRGLFILSEMTDGIRVRPGHGLCLDFERRASE